MAGQVGIATLYPPSSLRTQGPIRRGPSMMALTAETSFSKQMTVVMGPCVRRDDYLFYLLSNSLLYDA
jgi:hypothetical protein